VETGEAEMISVDFVARGGGNATAVDGTVKMAEKGQASQVPVGQGKGKGKEAETKTEVNGVDDSSILSSEDEEFIASLTARANAVKMLHSRIQLLRSYLSSLPPSYLTSASPPSALPQSAELNYPILRSIHALLSRLPLLLPADRDAFEQEVLAEKSEVSLVTLLGSLGRSVKDARELGRKFSIVEQARLSARKLGGGGDDFYTNLHDGPGQAQESYILP